MENEDVMECFQEQLGGGSVSGKDDLVNWLQNLTIEECEHDQVGTPPTPFCRSY